MARRASSSVSPGIIAGVVFALVILAAGALFLLKGEASAIDDATELPVAEWQKEGGRIFAGGEYRIGGTLFNRYLEGDMEIAIVQVDTQTGPVPVPVSIPLEVKSVNLERNSDYEFLVKVDQEGMPVVQEIRNR